MAKLVLLLVVACVAAVAYANEPEDQYYGAVEHQSNACTGVVCASGTQCQNGVCVASENGQSLLRVAKKKGGKKYRGRGRGKGRGKYGKGRGKYGKGTGTQRGRRD